MCNITLSEEIFSIIKNLGTDKVFLVPGGGNMFLVDAAGNQDGIEVISTHHEQAAIIAAEYYSRISGKLGVAVVNRAVAVSVHAVWLLELLPWLLQDLWWLLETLLWLF